MSENRFEGRRQSIGSAASKRSVHFDQAKYRLLKAATEYLLSVGLANWSYRGCARELGVSSNTLNYYFRSKDFLLVEILETVRIRDLPLLDEFKNAPIDTFEELSLAFWDVMTDGKQFPLGMAQVELYTLAMREPEKYSSLLNSEQLWIDGIASILRRANYPADEVSHTAKMFLWAYRGLYLSLLVSDHSQESMDQTRFAFKELVGLVVGRFSDNS